MRQALHSVSDRMLGMFLPKARAGACACFPSDNYYQYRCYRGQINERRLVKFSCTCVVSYGPWTDIGDC